ncbi:MAG: N-acetylmuramoyl-L-alanine amidase [Thauera sp.]|nr:N-acetylmuramoyl-L-alanine amidase [Thauera sp.]
MARAGVIRFLLASGLIAGVSVAAAQTSSVSVDIGHTNVASGAVSARGRSELEFNRELALQLAAALRGKGLAVRIVNEDGDIPSLRARPAAAAGTDLLVSIHHDSVGENELLPWEWNGMRLDYNDAFAGHSLFVSRDNPQTARSILCARVIGARLQRLGFAPTHKNGRRRAYADFEHAVHYYDGLAVLRHATMPAVLYEAGVIKNRAEELLLRDPQRQARMADAIATGIAACLRNGVPAADEEEADRRDGADEKTWKLP